MEARQQIKMVFVIVSAQVLIAARDVNQETRAIQIHAKMVDNL